jgi:cation:H+ antiporter
VATVVALVLLAAGLGLVIGGAELFFSGILAAAERLRVSAFALTLVVSGFELENVAAGIAANAKGLPGAAAGTFLGGTTFLALGVGGAASLAAPIRARLPVGVLVWLALAPVPLLALSADGELSRLDGVVLVVWSAASLAGLAYAGRGLAGGSLEDPGRRPFLRVLGGLGILTVGGAILGEGLRRVVSDIGVSQTLLGNTVIAASVEAEEIARVSVPARQERGDVAVANIVGTIVHFIALNAGVIAVVKPLVLDIDTRHLHLPVCVAATWLLASVLAVRGGISRGTGAVFLALYAAYIAAAIAVGV